MTKKISYLLILLLLLILIGCSKSETSSENSQEKSNDTTETSSAPASDSSSETTSDSDSTLDSSDTESNEPTSIEWPKEANEMTLPELKEGTISTANVVPSSMSDYKRNLVMEVVDVTQEAYDDYKQAVESQGFVIGVEYPGGLLMNYIKKDDTVDVELTLGFDPETGILSIIALDKLSNVEAEGYVSSEGLSTDGVPSEVPKVTFGELVDTSELDMGEGTIVYTLKYKNLTQDDVNSYKQEILNAGFSEIDGSYQLMDAAGTSMVMVGVDFDGEFMTMTAVKATMSLD